MKAGCFLETSEQTSNLHGVRIPNTIWTKTVRENVSSYIDKYVVDMYLFVSAYLRVCLFTYICENRTTNVNY
jgi:hypothetical protein